MNEIIRFQDMVKHYRIGSIEVPALRSFSFAI